MKINIYIIEDNIPQQQFLKECIEKFSGQLKYDVHVIDHPLTFYRCITNSTILPTDIFFLDYDLNTKITGLDIAKKIYVLYPNAAFIFFTSYSDQAIPIINSGIKPLGFIDKNIFLKEGIFSTITATLNVVEQQLLNILKEDHYFTLPSKNGRVILDWNAINYICTKKGQKNISYVQTISETLIVNESLKDIKAVSHLPFILNNLKSYIINLKNIKYYSIQENIIQFYDESELFVGRKIIEKVRDGLAKLESEEIANDDVF